MRALFRPVTRGVIAATFVALVAAGCGSDGTDAPSGDPLGVIVRAAEVTSEESTARLSLVMDVESGGQTRRLEADGALDLESADGVFEVDIGQYGLPGASGKMEARIVDGVIYMNVENLAKLAAQDGETLPFPDDVKWLSLDIAQLAEDFGVDPSTMQSSGSDPTAFSDMFESLRGVSSDVEVVGTEEVRGDATTHYRAEIDLVRALDEVPESSRERLEGAFALMGEGTMPVDVWVDGDNRVRRMRFEMDQAASGSATATIEYYDFGVDIDVEAPPADEVTDFMELLGGLFGQLGEEFADMEA